MPLSVRSRSRSHSLGVATLLVLLAVLPTGVEAQAPPPQHDWMGRLFSEHPTAMDQSLARFIFPGSHDAGTYTLQELPACEGCAGSDLVTNLVESCEDKIDDNFEEAFCELLGEAVAEVVRPWGQAQSGTLGAQLNWGARVFDLRFFKATDEPGLVSGNFYVHHTLAGPASGEIFDDIDRFVNDPAHAQEVLILRFLQMKEGDGGMSSASLNQFFGLLHDRIGQYMAPRPTPPICATDPGNSVCLTATALSGSATTLRAFLAQGSRVIVTCECQSGVTDSTLQPLIWQSLSFSSPYDVPTPDAGYSRPDDADYPWISDRQMFALLDTASAARVGQPQDQLFNLGVHIGVDEPDAFIVQRGIACHNGVLSLFNYFACDAVNNDWDRFRSLREVAAYTNPMAFTALVGLPRDRLNIVSADHYAPWMTDEVYRLNAGATRVRLNISHVQRIDGFGDTPDFYPVFVFNPNGGLPLEFADRQRVKKNDEDDLWPDPALNTDGNPGWLGGWTAWRAFRNALPDNDAVALFSIVDADPDPNPNDVATINGTSTVAGRAVSLASCFAGSCVNGQFQAEGTEDNTARVQYEINSCVWSWVPGEAPALSGACAGSAPPAPVLTPIGPQTVDELAPLTFTAAATGGTGPLTYEVTSCAAGLLPNNVTMTNGTVAWTPTEAHGGGTYCIRVVVTGADGATDSEDVTVTVNEVNAAPALTLPASFSTQWGVTPANLQATAADADQPANNLTFSLVSGPAWLTVSPDGTIAFAPIGVFDMGTHTVTVRVTDDGTPALDDQESFTITVEPRPTALTYTGRTTGQYSDQSTLSATLVDVGTGSPAGGTPLAGQTIAFTFDGTAAGTATTNASGEASRLHTVTLGAPGPYTVTATFTAANGYAGTGPATASFAAARETAAFGEVVFSGSVPVSQISFQVTGHITELVPEPSVNDGALAGDIGRATVAARLTGVATNQGYTGSCTLGAVIDVAGTSYDRKPFTCTFSAGPFVVDAYTLTLSIPTANAYYEAAAFEDALAVWDPNAGFATGGGTFVLDGDRVSFGFSYTISGNKLRSGFVAVRHMAGGGVCRVKSSNQMNAAAVRGNTATLSGRGNYSCSDAAGNPVPGQSQGNISIAAYAEDNSTSGSGFDRFWVSNAAAVAPNYLQMPASGGAAANAVLLSGGNVQVPQPQGRR